MAETRTEPTAAGQVRGGVSPLAVTTGTGVALGAAVILIVVQFLAYLWGGYTASRMGRGAPATHGLLVPLVSIIVLAILGGATWVLGEAGRFQVNLAQLPVERDVAVNYGIATALALLASMFGGGFLGGILGTRWHDRLEAEAPPDGRIEQVPERREVQETAERR